MESEPMNEIRKQFGPRERKTGDRGFRWLLPVIFCLAVLAWAPIPASAVNTQGPLVDFLVDAGQGQYDNAVARDFVTLLNEFELDKYSLRFSDGSYVSLGQSQEAIDAALLGKERGNLELTGLTGPSGSFSFATSADDEAACSSNGSTSSAALNDIVSCVGAAVTPGSILQSAATAISEVNTIDLLILRPTTQYMIAIRRFVEPMDRFRPRGQGRPAGGGAGDETDLSGPWGVYFQGGGSFGNVNSSPQTVGFNINNQLATAGVDYRFSDALVAGLMFNFTGSQSRFAGNAGAVNADIYRFMPFVSIVPFENAYIDIMTGYSYHAYDSRRGSYGTAATASYSADQALASINLGYSYAFDALELTGIAGGSYVGTDVNGYTEQGQGLLLSVGGYHVSSWTSNLGLELAYAHSVSFGVLRPQLRLDWVHEFENQPHNFTVTVPALSNLALPLVAGRRVSDWGNVSAGVQAVLPHGVIGFVNYQAQVFSGGDNHFVEGGVRLEF